MRDRRHSLAAPTSPQTTNRLALREEMRSSRRLVRVLVTGSTRGLGAAVAEDLRAAAHDVVTHGRTAGDVPADLARGLGALVGLSVDAIVANAAVSDPPAGTASAREVLATNVAAVLELAAAHPEARMIVVGSRMAEGGQSVAYATSKAAVEGFVRCPSEAARCVLRVPPMDTEMLPPSFDGVRADPARIAPAVRWLLEVEPERMAGRVFDAERLLFAPDDELLAAAPVAGFVRSGEAAPAGYPDPAPLRRALAERHGVREARVVLGPGATEIVARCLEVLSRPGEVLATSEPSWPWLAVRAELTGRRVRGVPVRETMGALRHDVAGLATAGARLVYVDSPGNPTGSVLDEDEVRRLLSGLGPEALVLLDETYAEVAGFEVSDPRVVRIRTLSKSHGLAKLRVGYAIASESVASLLERAAVPYLVSQPAIEGALAALEEGCAEHAEEVRAERRRLRCAFEDAGIATFASEAPFFLAEAKGGRADLFDEVFEDRGLGLVNVGTRAENDARIARLG